MVQRPTVLAAVPTPFDENGDVDLFAAKRRFAALSGVVDGLFVGGTVGEFPALDAHERTDLAVMALSVADRSSVIIHTGAPSARQAVELTRVAARRGATRFAAVTPYYFTAPLSRIVEYYQAIREVSGKGDVYAYLDPERTGADLNPDDLAWIVARAGLTGAVLAGGAALRFGDFQAAAPSGTQLFSCDDAALPEVAAGGGAGLVSGVASVFPDPYRRLADAVGAGDAGTVAELGGRVRELAKVVGSSVARLKMTQSVFGWSLADVRVPVAPVDAETINRIGKLIAEFG